MNVTPLIDVLLVLIIIFMIIVPTTPRGLEAVVPQPATSDKIPPPVATIVIQLRANDCAAQPRDRSAANCRLSLKINEDPVAWEDLKGRLVEIFKKRAERVAFIKADSDLAFEEVAQVIDAAHAAGVQNIGLMR